MGFDIDWSDRATCRTVNPEELFVEGVGQNRAKAVCVGCPVRTECLAHALDQRIEFGIWGGMTERERRALLRRRPEVISWQQLLETARAEHQRRGRPAASPAPRARSVPAAPSMVTPAG